MTAAGGSCEETDLEAFDATLRVRVSTPPDGERVTVRRIQQFLRTPVRREIDLYSKCNRHKLQISALTIGN